MWFIYIWQISGKRNQKSGYQCGGGKDTRKWYKKKNSVLTPDLCHLNIWTQTKVNGCSRSFKWLLFRVAIVLLCLGQSWICLLSWPSTGFSICPEKKCSNLDDNYMTTCYWPLFLPDLFSCGSGSVNPCQFDVQEKHRGLQSCPGVGRVARGQDSACPSTGPDYSKNRSSHRRVLADLGLEVLCLIMIPREWDPTLQGIPSGKSVDFPLGSCGTNFWPADGRHLGPFQNSPS